MRPVERAAVSAALCALDAELAKPWPEETAEEVAADFKRRARETLIDARVRRLFYGQPQPASIDLAAMYRRRAAEAMADAVSLREAA